MLMKNCNDTIRNRTRGLPACSAVPQPTAPPRAPLQGSREQIWNISTQCSLPTDRLHPRLVPVIWQNLQAWRNYILKMEVAISSDTPVTVHSHISLKTVILTSTATKTKPHSTRADLAVTLRQNSTAWVSSGANVCIQLFWTVLPSTICGARSGAVIWRAANTVFRAVSWNSKYTWNGQSNRPLSKLHMAASKCLLAIRTNFPQSINTSYVDISGALGGLQWKAFYKRNKKFCVESRANTCL